MLLHMILFGANFVKFSNKIGSVLFSYQEFQRRCEISTKDLKFCRKIKIENILLSRKREMGREDQRILDFFVGYFQFLSFID